MNFDALRRFWKAAQPWVEGALGFPPDIDPKLYAREPPKGWNDEPRKQRPTARVQHSKVHHVAGRRFLEVESNDGGDMEWVNLMGLTTTEGTRTPYLTESDFEELARRGLDFEKAEVIKPLWADGKKRQTISTELGGSGSGFGVDTVKKYLAAYSRALGMESDENEG